MGDDIRRPGQLLHRQPRSAASSFVGVSLGLILYQASAMRPFSSTRNAERTMPMYFLPYMLFSPHDPNTLYTAANVLFKSTDEGQSWQPISPDLTRNDKQKQQWSGGPITGPKGAISLRRPVGMLGGGFRPNCAASLSAKSRFLPISPLYGDRWFAPFLTRLLEGDVPTLELLGRNPFPDAPPTLTRARVRNPANRVRGLQRVPPALRRCRRDRRTAPR